MGIPKGDAEKGKKLFVQRCAHCHSVEAGGKQTHAPSLRGIVGRKSGSVPGYDNYTYANKNISRLRALTVSAARNNVHENSVK